MEGWAGSLLPPSFISAIRAGRNSPLPSTSTAYADTHLVDQAHTRASARDSSGMNCESRGIEIGSRWVGELTYARLGLVRARVVVGERERQHDGQPEDRTDDDKLGALGTIAGVHEVKNNKGGFDRGNDQSDDDIELMKVLESGPDGDPGAKH